MVDSVTTCIDLFHKCPLCNLNLSVRDVSDIYLNTDKVSETELSRHVNYELKEMRFENEYLVSELSYYKSKADKMTKKLDQAREDVMDEITIGEQYAKRVEELEQ